MNRAKLVLFLVMILCVGVTWGDTLVLRDGTSYSGQFTGANGEQTGFTEGRGVECKFPLGDVQSPVFSCTQDIVNLRN